MTRMGIRLPRVELYPAFSGTSKWWIDQVAAKQGNVRAALKVAQDQIYREAQARRMQHWDQGHVRVVKESGDLDEYVVLDDTASPSPNALAIEWGTGILRGAAAASKYKPRLATKGNTRRRRRSRRRR